MSQFMCLSTHACRMSNKQEELEATVQLANYNQITITKTWWNESHEWSTSTDGCKMLQRDPQRRSGETAALCVKKKIDWLHRAAFETQQWTGWEFMGKN